jgi:hypothetical protein
MKVWLALALSLLLSACATTYVPPTPSMNLPAKTKIGVLVVAGDNVNHSHIGTTVFNNFNTSYPFQWQMSNSIFDTLKAQLERPERFEVVDQMESDAIATSELCRSAGSKLAIYDGAGPAAQTPAGRRDPSRDQRV